MAAQRVICDRARFQARRRIDDGDGNARFRRDLTLGALLNAALLVSVFVCVLVGGAMKSAYGDVVLLFLVALTLIGWVGWAAFALSAVTELVAVLRRRSAPARHSADRNPKAFQ